MEYKVIIDAEHVGIAKGVLSFETGFPHIASENKSTFANDPLQCIIIKVANKELLRYDKTDRDMLAIKCEEHNFTHGPLLINLVIEMRI